MCGSIPCRNQTLFRSLENLDAQPHENSEGHMCPRGRPGNGLLDRRGSSWSSGARWARCWCGSAWSRCAARAGSRCARTWGSPERGSRQAGGRQAWCRRGRCRRRSRRRGWCSRCWRWCWRSTQSCRCRARGRCAGCRGLARRWCRCRWSGGSSRCRRRSTRSGSRTGCRGRPCWPRSIALTAFSPDLRNASPAGWLPIWCFMLPGWHPATA
jgi:hypothetical protein